MDRTIRKITSTTHILEVLAILRIARSNARKRGPACGRPPTRTAACLESTGLCSCSVSLFLLLNRFSVPSVSTRHSSLDFRIEE